MRPTPAAAAALLGAVVLHQLSRITGGAWLALGAGALLALPLAALLLRPRLGDLVVQAAPVHVRRGGVAEQTLTIRNRGRRSTPPLLLTDRTPGLTPVTVAVPGLPPGGQTAARLERTAVARGRVLQGEVELATTAPLGMLLLCRSVAVGGPFVVAPAAARAPGLPAGGEGTGSSSQPVAGAGTEVLGLRPFRSGEALTALHARATARHGRPVVLERERETGAGLVVLCTGPGRGADWEAAVEQACAFAEAAVRDGRPPRLLATGLRAPVRPTAAAVLDWHAGLDGAVPLDRPTLTEAVREAARGGALLLLAPPGSQALVTDVRRACAAAGARMALAGTLA